MKNSNRATVLKAIEGFLAAMTDRGDAVAQGLHKQLIQHFPDLLADEPSPYQVTMEHWGSPRYGGQAERHAGQTFTAEVLDQLESGGRMLVTIGDDNGHVDDQLAVAFEVTDLGAGTAATAFVMVYDGDDAMIKIAHQPKGLLIAPMLESIRLTETKLPDGRHGWMLLNTQAPSSPALADAAEVL